MIPPGEAPFCHLDLTLSTDKPTLPIPAKVKLRNYPKTGLV
jgi:hypothetical protein